jgi:Ni/Co efflux regulator RcnB
MRGALLIALAAATILSSPAVARGHHGGHGNGHHEWHGGRHGDWRHGGRWHGDRGRHEGHRYRAYVAPYGGRAYRRVRVGYRLRPAFYGPRYVITDYGYYGLRAPGRFLRWIRYGNDLLLVDIRRGVVLQVLPGRFLY